MDGRGLFTWTDGTCLARSLVLLLMLLKGRLCPTFHALCLAGRRYQGDFKQGKQNGRGVMTWANGVCHSVPWDSVLTLAANPCTLLCRRRL